VYQALRRTGTLAVRRARRVRAGDGWATVLVFHSVNDAWPHDGLNMRTPLFRDLCLTLSRDYQVLATSALMERLAEGRPLTGREVVITFDDGYLDNYEAAAPILSDLGLPAIFYLTAGFVGTDRQFPWDAERRRRTRMMTWGQARELSDMGFELGCHTWSHPDLGTEPISSAGRELGDAKRLIEDETGGEVTHFAYPFGGRANIRDEWREAARDAGLTTTFSCHGGYVTGREDAYHLPRLGCHQRTVTDVRIELDAAW
jgi:peptidoglycan/xylan/chitin deacetylase (PgdA/CDA1 family)